MAQGQLTVNVAAPSTAGTTAEFPLATPTEYARVQRVPADRNGWWKLSAGSGLVGILLFIVPGRRSYRATVTLWLICVLSLAMGCGGSGGSAAVTPPVTSTKITAPVTKAPSGTVLSFNVAIETAAGASAGNGTVQLLDGASVVATTTAADGVANFTNVNSLSVGTHAMSAFYSGDSNTQSSRSGTVYVTLTGTTSVGIATSPASLNNNASFSLTIN